jgi:hypothetical protein
MRILAACVLQLLAQGKLHRKIVPQGTKMRAIRTGEGDAHHYRSMVSARLYAGATATFTQSNPDQRNAHSRPSADVAR